MGPDRADLGHATARVVAGAVAPRAPGERGPGGTGRGPRGALGHYVPTRDRHGLRGAGCAALRSAGAPRDRRARPQHGERPGGVVSLARAGGRAAFGQWILGAERRGLGIASIGSELRHLADRERRRRGEPASDGTPGRAGLRPPDEGKGGDGCSDLRRRRNPRPLGDGVECGAPGRRHPRAEGAGRPPRGGAAALRAEGRRESRASNRPRPTPCTPSCASRAPRWGRWPGPWARPASRAPPACAPPCRARPPARKARGSRERSSTSRAPPTACASVFPIPHASCSAATASRSRGLVLQGDDLQARLTGGLSDTGEEALELRVQGDLRGLDPLLKASGNETLSSQGRVELVARVRGTPRRLLPEATLAITDGSLRRDRDVLLQGLTLRADFGHGTLRLAQLDAEASGLRLTATGEAGAGLLSSPGGPAAEWPASAREALGGDRRARLELRVEPREASPETAGPHVEAVLETEAAALRSVRGRARGARPRLHRPGRAAAPGGALHHRARGAVVSPCPRCPGRAARPTCACEAGSSWPRTWPASRVGPRPPRPWGPRPPHAERPGPRPRGGRRGAPADGR